MKPSPPPSPPPSRPPEAFPKTCGCGASYDAEAWEGLASRGTQEIEPGETLELRVCVKCGSTLSIVRA